MRSRIDVFLLIAMFAGMLVGRIFEPVSLELAIKCYEFGGLVLLIFIVRRLCFLPNRIVTGREQ